MKTEIIETESGEKIEVAFQFYGGGVIPGLAWGDYSAVNEESLTAPQIWEGGVFVNTQPPKVGDVSACVYSGQGGILYFPESPEVKLDEKSTKRKIVWIGKYPNDFSYNKNIVVMKRMS